MLVPLLLSLLILPTHAKTHNFDWTLSEITANPDGLAERSIIAVNDNWPFPTITINEHDQIVLNLTNNLKEPTSLHFHGIFQTNSTFMDGAAMISQCPIQPGDWFVYNFTVHQTGTYWYHSHNAAQYGDGFRGVLIVESEEGKKDYDENLVISLTDWYHTPTSVNVEKLFAKGSFGSEPKIDSSLFNETKDVEINVEVDKTYYLRIVNVGMSASQYLYIEDHDLTIVEVDGVQVEPTVVDSVKLATGQRYGALLKTKSTRDRNFKVVQATNMMMRKLYSVNHLIYDEALGRSTTTNKKVDQLKFINDFDLKPVGNIPLLPEPHHELIFEYKGSFFTQDHILYYTMNDKPHLSPRIPTVNTVFSSNSTTVSNPIIYGEGTNAYLIHKDEIIQVVINSKDHMRHPFHLHGHNFQVIGHGTRAHFDKSVHSTSYPEYPMIRDTVEVPGNGYVVLRFKADNPGVWFFHCHTEWHAVQGLGIVFIEDADGILNNQVLPKRNLDICENGGIRGIGNAAGNEDLFNMTGEIKTPKKFDMKFLDALEASTTVSPTTQSQSSTTVLSGPISRGSSILSSVGKAVTGTSVATISGSEAASKTSAATHTPTTTTARSMHGAVPNASLATQTIVIIVYGSFMVGVALGLAWIVNYFISKRNISNKRELVQNSYHGEEERIGGSTDDVQEENIPLTFIKRDDDE